MKRATVGLLLKTLRLRPAIASAEAHAVWSRADVWGLGRLLAFEGAEVWLYRRLRALDASAPVECMDALRTAAHRVALLGLRADAQTSSVLALLESAGIPCALIKGQARRAAAGRYPYADARGVADIDLLLPEDRAQSAWDLLSRHGYVRCYADPMPWTVSHHLPAIWDENRVAVELHTTTTDAVPAAEAWRRAAEHCDVEAWNGVPVSVPSATELLWQAVAHAVRDGARGYHLSAFLNASAILAPEPGIDWAVIEARIAAGEIRDEEAESPVPAIRICRWLNCAAELAGVALPQAVASWGGLKLERLLLWRSRILNSRLGPSVRERLLEEGTRYEAGMGPSGGVAGTSPFAQARRRSASIVAWGLYSMWRA